MSTMSMMDPELAAACAAMATEMFKNGVPAVPERGDVLGLRALLETGMASVAAPYSSGVSVRSYFVSTVDESEIDVRFYTDGSRTTTDRPAVVYLHGGGMISGKLDHYDGIARYYAQETGVPILLVDYRLAPESTATALAEDGFAALRWLVDRAGELGVDATRIAVMGDSGGGGVAAGTAILARERGIPLAKQILIYPMLDDRNIEPDPLLEDAVAWTHDNNWTCWRAVLGEDFGSDRVSPISAPARLEDFTNLPAAYIEVGELDIFRDESVAYATGLYKAGVTCELHVLPGVIHGHDRLSLDIGVSRRTLDDRCRVIAAL